MDEFKFAEKTFNLALHSLLSQAREQAIKDMAQMLRLAGHHEAADFLDGDNDE